MVNELTKPLLTLDAILDSYREVIGDSYTGYRNHCYRTYFICEYLYQQRFNSPLSEDEGEKLQIALAFHDIGLFTDNTLDYLPPSEKLAGTYLLENNKQEWVSEVGLLISEHHKITPFNNEQYPLVELFRKADLVDFSLGIVKHGVDKLLIKQLKQAFPNAGFHNMLIMKQLGRFTSHPTKPFPVFKW